METTRSPHTITDWAIGLSAFVVLGFVALYLVLLTRPTGWNLGKWSLVLLGVTTAIRLAYAAVRRPRQPR